jgi:hypothetical protein
VKYHLEIRGVLDGEIAHRYEPAAGVTIRSKANRFVVETPERTWKFSTPISAKKRPFNWLRITRRGLRTDKSNAVFNWKKDGIVVVYDGAIYFFSLEDQELTRVSSLHNCRNVLHGAIAVTTHGIYISEYGRNSERGTVPIWRSCDDGRSWDIVYEFPAGSIKHAHGVYFDKFTDRFWVPTGDFEGECMVLFADPNFSDVTIYGNGTQIWRPVSMFFTEDRVIWPMDSQLQTSYLQIFDRKSETLAQGQPFPGPVWYSKQFADGPGILQSTVELGEGVKSDSSHLFVSEDLVDWSHLAAYEKDAWPMPYFKFGVVAFADGPQNSTDFAFFGEALKGLDGKIVRAALRT